MGTRSLTKVNQIITRDEKKQEEVVCMYRQYDGYIDGHGRELAAFLSGFTIVNGLSMEEQGKTANGAGCLAAQMITHFKTQPGQFYIYPCGANDCGEEYTYTITAEPQKPIIVKVVVGDDKEIFSGSPEELAVFEETYDED